MCERINFNSGKEIGTVRQFQDEFRIDAKEYGFDGDENFLDCCLCDIDLESFFCDHIEYEFYYDAGEWWEKTKD